MNGLDTFQTRSTLVVDGHPHVWFSLPILSEKLGIDFSRLPVSIRLLLENLLRHQDGRLFTQDHILALSHWAPEDPGRDEIPFLPGRVLMQDFTGVPAVADLAAMRDALARRGGRPERINPIIPVHLVIDHSVQVDRFGSCTALAFNAEMEVARNRERYAFLKWGQAGFDNFHVVPPATGICHQVNLEFLAPVVISKSWGTERLVYPDTLVGLDSHTTMINSLGVLGWGVGGIEAEAVMLGRPVYLLPPRVIGFELTGRLPDHVTATDLVLMITRMTREKGVVGSFIEFFGPGLDDLSLPDRATIANMTPEFGATVTYFPVDKKTLDYLRLTGRSAGQVERVETYLSAQGLFRRPDTASPVFSETMQLDLGTLEPALAGPTRPHDRVPINRLKSVFTETFQTVFRAGKVPVRCDQKWEDEGGAPADQKRLQALQIQRRLLDKEGVSVHRPCLSFYLDHGAVVIAAITSCTNTSNPSVMLAAGLLARKAVARGLQVRPWVKTSLAPGSTVVTEYLRASGLLPCLEALRFHPVAYGCTTCIGNSGPLYADVEKAVIESGLVAASVLSGNRNYEGRVNPLTRANFLASPPLVIAYALAGTVNINLEDEPLGHDPNNEPVYLREIWPGRAEIDEMMRFLTPDLFRLGYDDIYAGEENWRQIPKVIQERYYWDPASTYIREPPFFKDMAERVVNPSDIRDARVLALLGDTITTDHISPAGAIPAESPAARYLTEQGVERKDYNSFGSRRGNHEVMMRGTFGNVRLRNRLAPGTVGGVTVFLPSGEVMSIYDAAMAYKESGTPLVILAGKDYGSGSSRDWAAKGTRLLGVRVVIAESFERIHRSNLVSMGVLPLQFQAGENVETLGLIGQEFFTITGIDDGLLPGKSLSVRAEGKKSDAIVFTVIARLDSGMEVDYYRHGGILPYVLRQMD